MSDADRQSVGFTSTSDRAADQQLSSGVLGRGLGTTLPHSEHLRLQRQAGLIFLSPDPTQHSRLRMQPKQRRGDH